MKTAEQEMMQEKDNADQFNQNKNSDDS